MVRMKVVRAVISGRTAKEVSPTRPRVTLVTASWLMGSLRYGAAVCVSVHQLELKVDLPNIRTRSVNEYIAHTLGAQYACVRPLPNGNNLLIN